MMRLFLCVIAFMSLSLCANQNVISVDRVVPHSVEFAFPNERNVLPELSDFQVKNFVLMSNENGERFAVVTIQNLANGCINPPNSRIPILGFNLFSRG